MTTTPDEAMRHLSPPARFLAGWTAEQARDRHPLFGWIADAARAVVAGDEIPAMPRLTAAEIEAARAEVVAMALRGCEIAPDEDEETQETIAEVEDFLVLVNEALKAGAQAPDPIH